MNNIEIIKKHCNHMLNNGFSMVAFLSSPVYDQIVQQGYRIVPDALKYLYNTNYHIESVVILLYGITQQDPYGIREKQPQEINLQEEKMAWLAWGVEEKMFIPANIQTITKQCLHPGGFKNPDKRGITKVCIKYTSSVFGLYDISIPDQEIGMYNTCALICNN